MELLYILKRFQRKYRLHQILFALLVFLSVLFFLLVLIIGFFINRLILIAILPLVAYISYKSEFFISIRSVSKKIEGYFPEIKQKLVPAVELFEKFKLQNKQQTLEGYSNELIDAAILQATNKLKNQNLEKIINYRKTRLSFFTFVGLLIIFLIVPIFSKNHFDLAWYIAFNPSKAPLKLSVVPGDIFVNKDSIVELSYAVQTPLRTLRTTLSAKGMKFTNHGLSYSTNVTADKEFNYSVAVKSNLGVPIMNSPNYHVRLNKPIEITELAFTYHYPTYTNLKPTQTRSYDIRAITGTKVEFNGIASMPLISAVRARESVSDTLLVKDNEFKGSFTITKQDSFEFVLSAENHRQGKSNRYYVTPNQDETPFVKMLLPGRDIDVPVNMQILVGMYGIDDFGLTRFDLSYTKPMTGETVSMRLKTVFNKAEDTLFYLWDLNKLNILPGEEVDYYGVVYDNDAVAGYKTARTETYSIRFPTLAEIYDQSTETNQSTMNRLEPIAETQNQLSKELDKISEHMREYREMNWEEKSKVNELLSKQEKLMSDITSLQQEVNNTMSDLYSGLMLDKETLEQLQKITDILNEILPEAMKQNLEKLRQELDKQNPDIAKSLENFKLSSEEMKEALKRALELLKNIQKEEQLMNLARKAEEIFKQQSQLNSRMEGEKLDKLVSPQEQIGNEIKELQNEIKETQENFDDSLLQAELAKIMQELEEMQLGNQVGNVSKNLGENNRSVSKKSGTDLLKDLEQLKDQLKALADMFKQSQNEMLTEKMLQVANDLNSISMEQEKIKPNEKRENLSEFVLRQKRLSEAATVVAETLARWSEQSLYVSPKWTQEIAKSVTSMERAAQALEDAVHSNTDVRFAQNLQEDAMYSLDIVTLQILRLAFMAQKSDGMKGGLQSLLQALSQMTADQMSLGQGMSGIPIPMPGGLTSEQMSQLGRLMSMQSQLRSQLEQLMQEVNSGKYGEMPGMTGSMQGALEEMKQIEKDLSELNVTRETIERQERTIDRLLDAQRSIRQKEYSEKREREIGKDYPERPRIILDKDLGETKKQLREELLRAMREGYPKEYEQMIKSYFESLIQE